MFITTHIKTPTRFSKYHGYNYYHSADTNMHRSAILGKYNVVKGYYKNKKPVFTPPNYESIDVGLSICAYIAYFTLIWDVELSCL